MRLRSVAPLILVCSIFIACGGGEEDRGPTLSVSVSPSALTVQRGSQTAGVLDVALETTAASCPDAQFSIRDPAGAPLADVTIVALVMGCDPVTPTCPLAWKNASLGVFAACPPGTYDARVTATCSGASAEVRFTLTVTP